MCDPPLEQICSTWFQLNKGSRRGVHGWVEEEQRFFTLWHFYGGNCAMGRWLSWWRNFFDGGQKSLAGFCVLVNAGYVLYNSYVRVTTGSPSCTGTARPALHFRFFLLREIGQFLRRYCVPESHRADRHIFFWQEGARISIARKFARCYYQKYGPQRIKRSAPPLSIVWRSRM